jgi:hypothetical protein
MIFTPFLILTVIFMRISLETIYLRNDVNGLEGSNVYAFLTAFQTGKLYHPPFGYPWNEQLYGPVFYLIGTGFATIAHGDPDLTTRLWRLLSFLSYIASAGAVGFISWKLEGIMCWAAVSFVLSLASAWALSFSVMVRPDELSILLILAALALYQVSKGKARGIFWVGVLGSVSCLTKQNTAFVLFAMTIDTLIARRFRDTATLILGCLPIPALILSTLWFLHEPFLANFLALRSEIVGGMTDAFSTFVIYARTNEIAVIALSVALLGAGISWKKERYRAILLAGGFVWLSALAALENPGGYSNYLILPWMISVLLVPAGLVRIDAWTRRTVLIPLVLTLLCGFLLIHQWNLLPTTSAANLDTSNVNKIKMLSDLSYLEARSRDPQLLDPYYYHVIYLQNLWSPAPIVEQIDNQEYDLLLIGGDDMPAESKFLVRSYRRFSTWGAEMIVPIMSHYRALCEASGYMALVPRDRASNVQVNDLSRILQQPCQVTDHTLQLAPGAR